MSTTYRGKTIHEVTRGVPQAGLWMVYCKHLKNWIAASDPVSHSAEVERVKELQDDPGVSEPHCVPL